MGTHVGLIQMLDAREHRAEKQNELLRHYQRPLICFTMNIPGPVKNSPLIRKGFEAGKADLSRRLAERKIPCLHFEELDAVTGNEAFYVADADPLLLKELTCQEEDQDELGRLFDMDVLLPPSPGYPDSRKLDRTQLGKGERLCMICGGPAKVCSSRRIHSVDALQQRTTQILRQAFSQDGLIYEDNGCMGKEDGTCPDIR